MGSQQAGSRVYREFDEHALNRLYLIQKAKNMGLTLKQIKPLLDAFLNYDMSDTEAISILLKQSERMDEIIQQAQDVKNLIQDQIDKIEGKVKRHCENHKYLFPRSEQAEWIGYVSFNRAIKGQPPEVVQLI